MIPRFALKTLHAAFQWVPAAYMTIILYNYFNVKVYFSYLSHIAEIIKCKDNFQIKLRDVEARLPEDQYGNSNTQAQHERHETMWTGPAASTNTNAE